MTKGLFTNSEEISFQYNYVQGNAKPAQDPNIKRNPAQTKTLCAKKRNKQIPRVFFGRTR